MANKKWYEIKALSNGTAEIYLYDEIGLYGITAKDFIDELNALGDLTDISLRINSPGGDAFDGAAIYNALLRNKATITTHVDGVAASMASVIAMAGDTVNMAETALFMIHNPSGIAFGDEHDMTKFANTLNKTKSVMISAYQRKTSFSDDEISVMMDDETWLNAEEAKIFGFIDNVSEPIKAAASLNKYDLSEFKNNPVKSSKKDIKLEFTKRINHNIEDDSIKTIDTLVKSTSAVADKPKEAEMADVKTSTVDVDKETDKIKADAKKAGIKAESDRRISINAIFANFQDHKEIEKECLNDINATEVIAREKLLVAIGKGQESQAKEGIVVGDDSHDKFKAAGSDAIQMRMGLIEAKQDNHLQNHSLVEMARIALEVNGKSTAGMSKMEFIGIAMTATDDFPFILSNNANKSMQKGYEESPETYQNWTSRGSLSDFKTADRNTLSLFSDLEEVKEGAEYKHGTFTEGREQIQLLTFGKLFSMTRQMVINDDLNAFTTVPTKMGRAARRKVGDLVYSVLNSNPNMADGNALFSVAHKNLAVTPSAITTVSLDEGRTSMLLQTDTSNNGNLNIRPSFLVTPVSIEGVALEVLNSKIRVDGDALDPGRPNSVAGMATVVSESRLDGNSTTAWFLAANSMINETIEVAFLDGIDAPFLEMQNGWTVDGVTAKVRIDAAAKALDWRGLYMNAGA